VEGRDDEERDGQRERDRPPGQFMDERLADDTARFLAEVKRLADRRREQPDEPESWNPPPS